MARHQTVLHRAPQAQTMTKKSNLKDLEIEESAQLFHKNSGATCVSSSAERLLLGLTGENIIRKVLMRRLKLEEKKIE